MTGPHRRSRAGRPAREDRAAAGGRRCSATPCCSACPSGVAAAVLGGVLRGTPGLVGALIGVVLGLAAGLVTTLVMRGTARTSPAGVMIGAMTSLAGKILLLMLFLVAFRGTTLFDNRVFGFALLAVTIGWIAGEVVGFVRAKVPVLDL